MHLLDANVLMEANRTYYPIDLAPTYWSWLGSSDLVGQVGSIERIRKEIADGQPKGEKAPIDPLVAWANSMPKTFWIKPSDGDPDALKKLATWAYDPEQDYRESAVSEFMASGDLHLIAQALADGSTVVTREQPAPESRKRIKIPDVCTAFGVVCIDPFTLYRSMGLQL